MKAYLRSVRIAPKKANLVAKMVRGMPVPEAIHSLEHTNKKAARILENVIRSAAANARQNDNQNPDDLVVKTLVVNKAITYHRGIPMARGRMRRIRKFLSHIEVTLGYPEGIEGTEGTKGKEVKEVKKAEDKPVATTKKTPEKKAPAKKATPRQSSGQAKKSESSSQTKKSPAKSTKTAKSKTSAGSTSSPRAGSSTKKSKTTDTSKSS